ncbi:MAG: tetratricopeptide repeat protein, partial [Chitinivibrionia bacterium]|nr:tetratricopeptide repeat protein [Chitinivibrionia bacterium]
FLLGAAPVLNLVPLGEISAERFLYLPSVGFALALGALFAPAFEGARIFAHSPGSPAPAGARAGTRGQGRNTPLAAVLFLALLAAYGARTVARIPDWKSEDVLFAKTVEASGGSARAHLNLGNAHRRNGRAQEAIAEYKKALEILPGYLEAMSNLAGMYRQQGRIDEAAELLARAIAKYPENAELHGNLGTILVARKRFDEGKRELELAIRHDPRNMRARYNLGIVHTMLKEEARALEHFEEVKDKGAEFELAYYYIGTIEAARGNMQYAKGQLERFLEIHRANDQFRSKAEELLREAGRPAAVPGR